MLIVARKPFKDAHTGELHAAGDLIEVTDERYAEIASVDPELIAKVAEEAGDDEKPDDDEKSADDEKPAAKKAAAKK